MAQRRRPASFWVAWALACSLGFSLLLNLGQAAFHFFGGGGSSAHTYQEKFVEGEGPDKIVLIELQGVIEDEPGGGPFGGGPSLVRRMVEELRQAAEDPAVKAVVLELDTPGGGVTASDVLYNEVLAVQEAHKKVVVHMGDVCASGGYYIAAPADQIMASHTSLTGSIGVIATFVDARELLEDKLGVREVPIKSGAFKDMGSFARPMREEERAVLQSVVDELYGRFVNIVAEGRRGRGGLPENEDAARTAIRALADGRVYTAEQAKQKGLVDSLGYLEDAIDAALDLCSLEKATVVRYVQQPSLRDLLTGNLEGRANINHGVQVNLGNLGRAFTPRVEYRWAPGR